jgi:hypothetical protein
MAGPTVKMSQTPISMASSQTEKDIELSNTSSPDQDKTRTGAQEDIMKSGSNKLLEDDPGATQVIVAAVEVGTGTGQFSEPKRLEGMALWLLTTGMMLSMFIMSLDKAIIGMVASLD